MGSTAPATERGASSACRRTVVVMSHDHASQTAAIEALLESSVTGSRGEALRSQLAGRYPRCSAAEIEDAVQHACACFIDGGHGITTASRAYAWLRIVAHRALSREYDRDRREPPIDPAAPGLDEALGEAPSPEQLLIDREDDADLAALAEDIVAALCDQQRRVLALHEAGLSRREIAGRLGLTRRAVKRDVEEIMETARAQLASHAGGGCPRGEPLVVRMACRLASPTESSQAQLHIKRCPDCSQLHDRLCALRDKAGALLPGPTGDQTTGGVIERTAHNATDALAAVKQQLADAGAQVKQQTTATYVRVADPTPLAGARPGAVAAVVAGCLAIGTGAYTCVEKGVNPLAAIPGLEQREPPDRKAEAPDKPAAEQPAAEPIATPVAEQPPPDATPAPAAPEPAPTPPPPPPEQSFEPTSPSYPSSRAAAAPQPAPVADGRMPEFGGP